MRYIDEVFSEEQIAEYTAKLSVYEKFDEVATLANGEYDPAVVAAFAALAKTLKAGVTTEYGGLKVRTEKSAADQRAAALRNLRYAAESGEVTPANLGYANQDA